MDHEFIFLFITGIVGGFVAGFLGIGGGIIYVVILPGILSNYNVQDSEVVRFIIANSVFCILTSAISGNISQFRQGRFYIKEVMFVGITGVISSILVLNFVVHQYWYSKDIFNIVLVLLLILILVQSTKKFFRQLKFVREVSFDKKVLILTGFLGGTYAALSGLGGGAIVVALLTERMKMNIKKAKIISLGMIFSITATITIYNLSVIPQSDIYGSFGYIIFPLVIPMALGGIFSASLGVSVSRRTPSLLISYAFVFFLSIVIIKKSFDLYQAFL